MKLTRKIIVASAMLIGAQGYSAETLPTDLKWQTNEVDPIFASKDAVRGGEIHVATDLFPLTFRVVGPQSNTALYTPLVNMQMGLIGMHPQTLNPVPLLAKEWAFGADGRSVYYKLNENAKYSDGHPVTAEDFVFTLEFMKSKDIMAPFYNNFYTENFETVHSFDKHTLLVRLNKKKPHLTSFADLPPTPRHFYGSKVDKDFVKKYNWKPAPVSGPYYVSTFKKGSSVTFTRVKDWWGNDLRYMKGRYNFDKIVFDVVREVNVQFEWLMAGKLDLLPIGGTKFWHERTKDKTLANGYVERLMAYDQNSRPLAALWMNREHPVLSNSDVRIGIHHALDYSGLLEKQMRGEYVRYNTAGQGYKDYENKTIRARSFDLKLAAQSFARAGWTEKDSGGILKKGNQKLSFAVSYSNELWTPHFTYLREQAKKAGVELNLKFMDGAALFKAIDAGGYDAVFLMFASNGIDLTPEYRQMFHSSSDDNLTRIKDPVLDKMLDDYNEASEQKTKVDLAHKIQQWIYDDAAVIPAVVPTWTRGGYWRWIRFPEPPSTVRSAHALGMFDLSSGGLMWLDAQRKKETQDAMKAGKTFPPVTRIDDTHRRKDEK